MASDPTASTSSATTTGPAIPDPIRQGWCSSEEMLAQAAGAQEQIITLRADNARLTRERDALIEAAQNHIDSLDWYEHGDVVPINRTRGTADDLRQALAAMAATKGNS